MGQHSSVNWLSLWVEAARPKTLWASLSPVILGTGISAFVYEWEPLKSLACAVVALALQIAVNFANDADDAESGVDSQARQGPRRLVASGLISKFQMRLAVGLCLLLAAATAFWAVPFYRVEVWIAGALAMVAALTYTGGRLAYGYRGLGEVLCFIFFGPVAVVGTVIVSCGFYSYEALWLGCASGFLSVALLEVNNLRDLDGDKAAGKLTLAARFGRKLGLQIYKWCWFLAMIFTSFITYVFFWVWLSVLVLLFFGARLTAHLSNAKPNDAKGHNLILAQTSFAQFIWALSVVFAAWLLYGV